LRDARNAHSPRGHDQQGEENNRTSHHDTPQSGRAPEVDSEITSIRGSRR
jgi:hypothetical protein